MFKTEKVVCSTCFRVDKSGLWDINPSPTCMEIISEILLDYLVFIAVQHLKGACLLPTVPLVLFN